MCKFSLYRHFELPFLPVSPSFKLSYFLTTATLLLYSCKQFGAKVKIRITRLPQKCIMKGNTAKAAKSKPEEITSVPAPDSQVKAIKVP